MTIYHVGISGGKDSGAAMLFMRYESGIPWYQVSYTFCDTGNEDEATYEHVEMLSRRVAEITTLKPERDFYELARHKKRFPSAKARFCTEHLKMEPTKRFIQQLQSQGHDVIAVSGVRAGESADRATLPEKGLSPYFDCIEWRPLLKWTIDDVWAIHERYGIPRNPLYDMGAQRVGCFPCIMSRKVEVRNIAINFPDRIDRIRREERAFTHRSAGYSTFFAPNMIPARFRSLTVTTKAGKRVKVGTIDDVVRWAKTGYRALGSLEDQGVLDLDGTEPVSCSSGFCE